jgi:tRNA(Ile)-lysidine synthase
LMILPGQEGFLLRWLEIRDIPWQLAHDFIMTVKQDSGKWLSHGSTRLSRTSDGYFFEIINSISHQLAIESTGEYETDHFTFSIYPVPYEAFEGKLLPGIAYISGDVVTFPLRIRSIEQGDAFQPLGMPGKTKKIQDLLVDRKLERHEKDRTLVLTNPQHIIWVIDQQLDDRAKVKAVEKEIFLLKFNWKT